MKKLYILLIALLAINSGMGQGCLPEGIHFTTQAQIDSFPINYPNCVKIQGHVWIESETINNLFGLNCIESIGDYLSINGNLKLENLDGLENLDSIGGYLTIGLGYLGYGNKSLKNINGLSGLKYTGDQVWIGLNDSLTDLSGLEGIDTVYTALSITENPLLENLSGLDNVKSVNGDLLISNCNSLADLSHLSNLHTINGLLWIVGNKSLKSLNGIEYIESESISDLFIIDNDSLSLCEVESICIYIANPNGITNIQSNTTGCNNVEEVEAACQVGIENIIHENEYTIFPNPSSSRFSIQFSLENEEQVKLLVLNNLGQVVATLVNETLSEGEHEINWNAGGMPAGVYFYNIQIGNQVGTGKMVLMK